MPSLEALTHLNSRGEVRMVDVGGRGPSLRCAVAEGWIAMAPTAMERILSGGAPKGDVLAAARLAAIQAAKRTWELIPLCHPLALSAIDVSMGLDNRLESSLRMTAEVSTHAPTGVEMEALTAVQVGLLTLYDMAKSLDPAMTIGPVRVVSKLGGRGGPWHHPDHCASPAACD